MSDSAATAVAAKTGNGLRGPTIACRNVVKEFVVGKNTVQALRGVDIDILPGELTLLVGPSGCGKTTLLSCIA